MMCIPVMGVAGTPCVPRNPRPRQFGNCCKGKIAERLRSRQGEVRPWFSLVRWAGRARLVRFSCQQRTYTVPEPTPNERAYVHQTCGTTTVVTDEHFTMICNPFRLVTGTFCVGCENFFPLTQFVWADTGEVVADARKRWAEEAPEGVKRLQSPLGCWLAILLGGGAGAGIGWLAGGGATAPLVLGGVFGLIGFALVWAAFVKYMISNVYDWDPRRLK